MSPTISRIALSTGGGDAPGLNAVIRAATLAARNRGWDVVGIRDGFNGLMYPDNYPNQGLVELTRDSVRGIVHQGGTIIGTTNRGNPTAFPVQLDGRHLDRGGPHAVPAREVRRARHRRPDHDRR